MERLLVKFQYPVSRKSAVAKDLVRIRMDRHTCINRRSAGKQTYPKTTQTESKWQDVKRTDTMYGWELFTLWATNYHPFRIKLKHDISGTGSRFR